MIVKKTKKKPPGATATTRPKAKVKTTKGKAIKKAATKPGSSRNEARIQPKTVIPPKPAGQPEAASAERTPAKVKKIWIQAAIVAVVVLVTVEVTMILKSKIEHQGKLQPIRVIGLRGGPPEVSGKFWGPGQIRVDSERDRVCMIDGNFFKVIFWNRKDGTHIIELDKQGEHQIAPGGKVQNKDFSPMNGAFDGEGNLYVVDRQRAEVTVFSPDYKVKGTWPVPPPQEITADKKGNIYVVDKMTCDIVGYTSTGKEVRRFGGKMLKNPGFMATDDAGNIYVVDRGSKKIVVFSDKGKLKDSWATNFQPFGNPDIDVQGGKVYLCEHDNQRIFVYTTDGKMVWDLVAAHPAVIGVDAEGLVYVSCAAGIQQFRIIKRHKK